MRRERLPILPLQPSTRAAVLKGAPTEPEPHMPITLNNVTAVFSHSTRVRVPISGQTADRAKVRVHNRSVERQAVAQAVAVDGSFVADVFAAPGDWIEVSAHKGSEAVTKLIRFDAEHDLRAPFISDRRIRAQRAGSDVEITGSEMATEPEAKVYVETDAGQRFETTAAEDGTFSISVPAGVAQAHFMIHATETRGDSTEEFGSRKLHLSIA
jgi:hypothetical protein